MFRFILPGSIWTIVVIAVSLIPSSNFDARQFDIEGIDKVIHFSMYALMTLFWSTGFKRQYKSKKIRKYAFHIAVIGGFLLSLILEVFQEIFIFSRSFDWLDLIANGIGCIFGVVVFKLIYKGSYK